MDSKEQLNNAPSDKCVEGLSSNDDKSVSTIELSYGTPPAITKEASQAISYGASSSHDTPQVPSYSTSQTPSQGSSQAASHEASQARTKTNIENGSDAFISRLIMDGNQKSTREIADIQCDMLARYEKTNEMLINFNSLSESRLQTVFSDLSTFSSLLKRMKVDLDKAHTRIRTLKSRVSRQHPSSFAKATSENSKNASESSSNQ